MNDIIKNSLKVLILGSVLSSFGGLSLEIVKTKLAVSLPLLFILPSLTDMIGDAGTIVVSKITTYLYMGKLKSSNLLPKFIVNLFLILTVVFSFSAVYVSVLALLISYLYGFTFNSIFVGKMIFIVLLTTISILLIIFFISLVGGVYAFNKNIDPDDLLIPLTTSIADLGSLILFSLLIKFFL